MSRLAEKINIDIPSIEFKEAILDNGMKVVMSRFGNIPSAAINITFHVGSKDEEENKTGLAHLFEHLMFEGSKNVPKGKFDEILIGNGGDSNAYTSWDSTSYYIAIPSNQIETAFWIDSDRFAEFNVSEESLRIQKDVILEEKLLYSDNSPYGSVDDESSKRLFRKSSYRWPIIGYMDDLKKMTLDDLKDFHGKYYKPNNAVISIVGDIDYDKTIRLVEKYYGCISRGNDFVRNKYEEDEITEEIRDDIKDSVNLEGKFIFYRIPEAGTKEFYAMSLLNGILSEGDSSRFFNELEYKSKLVSECDSYIFGMERASIFSVMALAMKGKRLDDIERKIDEIINDIKDGNLDEKEIMKIKNKVETFYNSKRQSIVSLADKFSYFKTFFNDCDRINFEILDYISISRDDIIGAANKFLNKNQRVVLNYIPKK